MNCELYEVRIWSQIYATSRGVRDLGSKTQSKTRTIKIERYKQKSAASRLDLSVDDLNLTNLYLTFTFCSTVPLCQDCI